MNPQAPMESNPFLNDRYALEMVISSKIAKESKTVAELKDIAKRRLSHRSDESLRRLYMRLFNVS